MTTLLRSLGVASVLGIALGGLASCSAADRAVSSAQRCSDEAPASPTVVRHQPGQAVLMAPAVRSSLPLGPVRGWERVVDVADAGTTLAAVHQDGTVSVVGVDHAGLLAGTGGGAAETLVPSPVPGVSDAVAVAAVGSAFLVTHTDGTVTAWGDDLLAGGGKRNDNHESRPPATVPGAKDVVSVADGALSVLALRSDGGITGWGINLVGMLGDKDGTEVRDLKDAPDAVSLAYASGAAVVATGAGEVCAWGNNVQGLLGVEPRGGQTTRPLRIGGIEGATQVAGGNDFALALGPEGRVWAWGRTVSGVLGDGNLDGPPVVTPQQVPGLPPLQRIFAAGAASYGINDEGELWGWGNSRRAGPYATEGTLPRQVPLPGLAQEVSGNVVLLGPPA